MVIVNAQTRAATMDLDIPEVMPTGMVLEGVWNEGRHAVKGQRLHRVTVPARDAVVLVSVDGGAAGSS
jgi:hypothetical protein